MRGTTALRIAYPTCAWVCWAAWVLGSAGGWALLCGAAAALVVLLPWAIRTGAFRRTEVK